MQIVSEIRERVLKVARFPWANNTLSPSITSTISSLALSRDIIRCWIVIIINRDPLMAKPAMSSERRFDVQPDSQFGGFFISAPSVQLFLSTSRAPMPPYPAEGIGTLANTKRPSVPSWVTWMYCLAEYNFLSEKLAWVKTKPETRWHLAAQLSCLTPPK